MKRPAREVSPYMGTKKFRIQTEMLVAWREYFQSCCKRLVVNNNPRVYHHRGKSKKLFIPSCTMVKGNLNKVNIRMDLIVTKMTAG